MRNLQMVRNSSLLVLLLFVCKNTASAQQLSLFEGRYVTMEGKTVPGFFNLEDLSDNVIYYYKDQKDTNPVNLFPGTTQEIFLNEELHILSVEITNTGIAEQIFILQKLTGEINFYAGNSELEGDIFFISSIDHPEIIRINRQSPGIFLQNYLGECQHASEPRIVRYYENTLLKEIQRYYQCLDQNSTYRVVGNFNSLSIGFGVQGIGFLSKSRIMGPFQGEYAITLGGGVGSVIRLKLSNSLSLNVGVNYVHKVISQPDSIDYINSSGRIVPGYRAPIKLKYSPLAIPLSITYYFNKTNREVFPVLSVGASYVHSGKVKVVQGFPNSSRKELNPRDQNTSFFIEGGISRAINKRSSIELMLNYTYELEALIEATGGALASTNRLALVLGYYF